MSQLNFRPEPNIARQQTEHWRLSEILDAFDELTDTRTGSAFQGTEKLIEPKDVVIEKTAKILRCGIDSMLEETFPNEGPIGPSGEIQFSRRSRQMEFMLEGALERFDPGSPRPDES